MGQRPVHSTWMCRGKGEDNKESPASTHDHSQLAEAAWPTARPGFLVCQEKQETRALDLWYVKQKFKEQVGNTHFEWIFEVKEGSRTCPVLKIHKHCPLLNVMPKTPPLVHQVGMYSSPGWWEALKLGQTSLSLWAEMGMQGEEGKLFCFPNTHFPSDNGILCIIFTPSNCLDLARILLEAGHYP